MQIMRVSLDRQERRLRRQITRLFLPPSFFFRTCGVKMEKLWIVTEAFSQRRPRGLFSVSCGVLGGVRGV